MIVVGICGSGCAATRSGWNCDSNAVDKKDGIYCLGLLLLLLPGKAAVPAVAAVVGLDFQKLTSILSSFTL